MKYGLLNLGQIEALVNKLGGMEAVERILRGEITVKMMEAGFTIRIGTAGLQSAHDLRCALEEVDGLRISAGANDILNMPTFTTATEEIEVELVVLSVAELGCGERATHRVIYDRAMERGLYPCPAEVGPQLLLQCKDQVSATGLLLIRMEPIINSHGIPNVFGVGWSADDEFELFVFGGQLDRTWHGSDRWVFLRRR